MICKKNYHNCTNLYCGGKKKKKKIKLIETDQGKGEEEESEMGSKINLQLLQNNLKVQENKMFHVLTDFDFRLSKK